MAHRHATKYAKNHCNQTPIVKVIVENVVTCFLGTQCRTVFKPQEHMASWQWSVLEHQSVQF